MIIYIIKTHTMNNDDKNNDNIKEIKDLNNICENCAREDISVSQNLILFGFKQCESCRVSKTIFPV
ncbi:MAG: hypothetical protein CBC78_004075 [Candidatus Pelagibacter sp. TMED118]|nr:MAG: hypothetical protein CBC78_004075 [Candidatus Pelagibacter sp. TMED118]|tara:strand:- start:1294 stop:1491 length:198 start_codon:yes stop_codon:yes gene_type:complete